MPFLFLLPAFLQVIGAVFISAYDTEMGPKKKVGWSN